MKQCILLLFLACSIPGIAQQRLANQWNLYASGDYVFSNGCNINLGAEKILGTSLSSLRAGLSICPQNYVTDTSIPEDVKSMTVLAHVGYGYSLESIIPNPFFVNLHIDVAGGYQNIKDDILQTSAIHYKSKFVYGGILSVQGEMSLYKNWSIYIEPKGVFFTSDIKKTFFCLGGGVKYYL